MKKIWLVRHGESTAQAQRKHDPDPELSRRGLAQASALHEALQPIHFDHILISPLKRTRRTYELARPRGRRIAFDSRLIECHFDVDYARLLPYTTPDGDIQPDEHDAWLWPADRRVRSLLDTIDRIEARHVLLVAHWGILSLLLMGFLGAVLPHELVKGRIRCSAPLANGAYGVLVAGHPKYGNCLHVWNACDHLRQHTRWPIDEPD